MNGCRACANECSRMPSAGANADAEAGTGQGVCLCRQMARVGVCVEGKLACISMYIQHILSLTVTQIVVCPWALKQATVQGGIKHK